MHLCIYAFVCLCIYASMHLCIYAFVCLCIYVPMYLCIFASIQYIALHYITHTVGLYHVYMASHRGMASAAVLLQWTAQRDVSSNVCPTCEGSLVVLRNWTTGKDFTGKPWKTSQLMVETNSCSLVNCSLEPKSPEFRGQSQVFWHCLDYGGLLRLASPIRE